MEGLVYESADIDVRLDRVKSYLSITSASSIRRQNSGVNTGCTVIDTPISFCSFFIDNCIGSKYKEIVWSSSSRESPLIHAVAPLEGSLQVCYILFKLFIASSENKVKINANIKKLFSKYGFDLKLDLSDEKTILHILDHLSRCYKWKGHHDYVSMRVSAPIITNTALMDTIKIFKSRMNLPKDDDSSFVIEEFRCFPENIEVYFSHHVTTRWDRCFGETEIDGDKIIKSDGTFASQIPVINLTHEHALYMFQKIVKLL